MMNHLLNKNTQMCQNNQSFVVLLPLRREYFHRRGYICADGIHILRINGNEYSYFFKI